MGRLTSIAEIKQAGMLGWYFEFNGKYMDQDPAFALECAVDQRHFDYYDHSKKIRKIEVRKFIDQCLTDTVIFDYLDLSYYYWAKPGEPNYLEREIRHGYYRFFFESEASQVQFALRFSDIIGEKLRWQDDQVPHRREELSRIWTPPEDRSY
jgi:hypothetical protein